MNLGAGRVVFRHRSTMDVLDLAARFLVQERRAFLLLSAAVLLPAWALVMLVAHGAGNWEGALFLAGLFAVTADLPFTLLASRLVFDADVPVGATMLDAVRALPRLLLGRLVQGLVVGVGLSLCGLPGIWLAVLLQFLPEVIALEKTPVFKSFTRCNRLLSGQFGDALVAWIWLTGLQIGAVLLFDFAGRTILRDVLQINPPRPVWKDGHSSLAITGLFLSLPYLSVARLLTYLNIRTRTEGWDIQARFVAIAQRLAPGGAP